MLIQLLLIAFSEQILRVSAQLVLSPSLPLNCGSGPGAWLCGQATVLRGQSHIGIPEACFKRPDSGPCSQDIVRIYYDFKTFTCKPFSFSGCGGNSNRFVSIKNCYKLCHPYYRSRFMTLGVDQGKDPGVQLGEAPEGGDDGGSTTEGEGGSSTEGEGGEGEEGAGSTTEGEEGEGGSSTSTEGGDSSTEGEETEDPWNQSMVYFQASDGNKVELKPALQVVHDFDPLNNVRVQSRSGFGGGQPPAQPLPGSPGWRALPVPLGAAPSGQGYLSNIQHENYEPQASYIKTRDGVKETPISAQKIVFT